MGAGELLARDRQGVPIVAADHVKSCVGLVRGQGVRGPELTVSLDDEVGVDEVILRCQFSIQHDAPGLFPAQVGQTAIDEIIRFILQVIQVDIFRSAGSFLDGA